MAELDGDSNDYESGSDFEIEGTYGDLYDNSGASQIWGDSSGEDNWQMQTIDAPPITDTIPYDPPPDYPSDPVDLSDLQNQTVNVSTSDDDDGDTVTVIAPPETVNVTTPPPIEYIATIDAPPLTDLIDDPIVVPGDTVTVTTTPPDEYIPPIDAPPLTDLIDDPIPVVPGDEVTVTTTPPDEYIPTIDAPPLWSLIDEETIPDYAPPEMDLPDDPAIVVPHGLPPMIAIPPPPAYVYPYVAPPIAPISPYVLPPIGSNPLPGPGIAALIPSAHSCSLWMLILLLVIVGVSYQGSN